MAARRGGLLLHQHATALDADGVATARDRLRIQARPRRSASGTSSSARDRRRSHRPACPAPAARRRDCRRRRSRRTAPSFHVRATRVRPTRTSRTGAAGAPRRRRRPDLSLVTADDQLEPRPDVRDGADLDIHEAERQCERADHVLGDVCRDTQGFLRGGVTPASPHRARGDTRAAPVRAPLSPGRNGGRRRPLRGRCPRSWRRRAAAPGVAVFLRRMNGPHRHAGPEPELGGEGRPSSRSSPFLSAEQEGDDRAKYHVLYGVEHNLLADQARRQRLHHVIDEVKRNDREEVTASPKPKSLAEPGLVLDARA